MALWTNIYKLVVSYGLIILIQTFPKTTALKSSNVDEYLVENQRTHRRQNYVVQREIDNEMSGDSDLEIAYAAESFEPDSQSGELSALIVDYANMIRNDIILLDNSVETKTRKRGNIKAMTHNRQVPDFQCSCEVDKIEKFLGNNYYPRYVETTNCSDTSCHYPYRCQRSLYDIQVLRTAEKEEKSALPVINEHKRDEFNWYVVETHTITTGCNCVKDYNVVKPNTYGNEK